MRRVRAWFTDRRVVLLSLVLFVLLIRLLSMMMIHTGVDERDYWFSAKRLLLGMPYDIINHRTVRFAVILPVLLVQAVAGVHPNVYYVAPIILSVLQVILMFRLGERLHSRFAGVLASVLLVLFPYMIRAGSQIRPGIFSLTYLLLSLGFLLDYLEGRVRPRLRLAAAAVILFVAYQSKITNLYFVPGFLLAVFFYSRRKWSDALLFCLILIVLYLLETLILSQLFDEPFGRLGIIAKNHLRIDYIEPMRFWGLFRRYVPSRFPLYWPAVFLLFLPAAWLLHRWHRRSDYTTLALLVAGFLLAITFAVARLRPLVPVEPFHHRFFLAALGPVLLVDAIFVLEVWRRVRGDSPVPKVRPTALAAVLAGMVLAIGVVFSSGLLPSGLALYFNDLRHPARHPLALNHDYLQLVNDSVGAGTPLVAREGNGGLNALATATHYFVDSAYLLKHGLPSLTVETVQDTRVSTISLPAAQSLSVTQNAVLATRNPFHIELISLDEALARVQTE